MFMGRRSLDKLRPGLWEWPGGKREHSETLQMALVREIREELGIQASVGDIIGTCRLRCEEVFNVHLFHVFTSDTPTVSDGSHFEFGWIPPRHAVMHMPLAPSAYMLYSEVITFIASPSQREEQRRSLGLRPLVRSELQR